MQETWVQSLGWEDPLEKEIATHSNTLAWKIPWMEEPGGLQSIGFQSRTRLSDFSFFLQEIFLTEGLNLGLLHCRQMFYHLTHQGSQAIR